MVYFARKKSLAQIYQSIVAKIPYLSPGLTVTDRRSSGLDHDEAGQVEP